MRSGNKPNFRFVVGSMLNAHLNLVPQSSNVVIISSRVLYMLTKYLEQLNLDGSAPGCGVVLRKVYVSC